MRRVTRGYWIIGTAAISHDGDTETVFHPDTPAEEFDTEAEMLAAHRERFPDQYQEDAPYGVEPRHPVRLFL